jgi:hypothetical protein
VPIHSPMNLVSSPSGFPTEILHGQLSSLMHAACPVHLNTADLIEL